MLLECISNDDLQGTVEIKIPLLLELDVIGTEFIPLNIAVLITLVRLVGFFFYALKDLFWSVSATNDTAVKRLHN